MLMLTLTFIPFYYYRSLEIYPLLVIQLNREITFGIDTTLELNYNTSKHLRHNFPFV